MQQPVCRIARHLLAGVLACAAASALAAEPGASPADRQAEVREKGAHVMPFNLDQTLHTFDKTPTGGIQRVRVRAPAPQQVDMIRMHLREIARAFAERDFAKPEHIHGADMPGLAALRAAPAGALDVTYRELPDGAEIDYAAHDPALVQAVHDWFDAQLSDHGHDAATSVPTDPRAFAWLAGSWSLSDRDRRIEETWSEPANDMLIGMSRTLQGGRTTAFEFMRIAAGPGGIVYVAQPHGKPPVEFALQSWDGTTAVFVNRGDADRVKRIVYRRDGATAMTARIEGAVAGADFSEDYAYRRLVPAPAAAQP